MLTTEKEFILFDTEFTAWEGSSERNWSGPGELREIVQIGVIKVNSETLTESDFYTSFVGPKINPILSAYLIDLIGITQESVGRLFLFQQQCLNFVPDGQFVEAY